MAKEKALPSGSFWAQLWQLRLYKKTQGRVTRQTTFFVLAAVFVLAAYRFDVWMVSMRLDRWLAGLLQDTVSPTSARRVLAILFAVVGVFFSYRLVNYSRFADFLISVEAEMSKVSWPSRGEIIRSSIVVIVVMFSMAIALFVYDFVWLWLLRLLGIRL